MEEWGGRIGGGVAMVVTYDPVRVFGGMAQAVDAWCDGLWHEVAHDREELIREAKGLADAATGRLGEIIPEGYHDYVSDEDVMTLAVAMALRELEGWDVAVEEAEHLIMDEVYRRAQAELLRD
jgi:hypothetical protein